MAEFSPALPLRDGDGRFGQPVFPRSRSGSESEAELSQSLALTKTRSYGSTASVTAPLTEKYIEHRVSASDTLQGIALRYGVTMEHIKRANKIFSNDCIFLKTSLNIPVISEKCISFNGLNSLESPDSEASVTVVEDDSSPSSSTASPSPSPQEPDTQPEELSAKDYLQRLDLKIQLSKQAARKLKEEDISGPPIYQASGRMIQGTLFLHDPAIYKLSYICKARHPAAVLNRISHPLDSTWKNSISNLLLMLQISVSTFCKPNKTKMLSWVLINLYPQTLAVQIYFGFASVGYS